MPRPISSRQRSILSCIKQHIDEHGYPPTVREIGEAVSLSSSTVHAHLKALEEKGLIQREAVLTRAIKIVGGAVGNGANPIKKAAQSALSSAARAMDSAKESMANVVNVPVLGNVAAGRPILAVEDVEDYFPLPADFVGGDGFILRVRGDSMIDDGIYNGDYVVVRQQQSADNGDTVVAMIDSEATVKRFYKEKKRIRLQPANETMSPIYADSPEVLGKVVGVVRRFN